MKKSVRDEDLAAASTNNRGKVSEMKNTSRHANELQNICYIRESDVPQLRRKVNKQVLHVNVSRTTTPNLMCGRDSFILNLGLDRNLIMPGASQRYKLHYFKSYLYLHNKFCRYALSPST